MFERSMQGKSSTQRARSAEHRGRRGGPGFVIWAGTGATMVKGSAGVFGK